MFVITDGSGIDAEVGQKLARVPRVLTSDQIDFPEDAHRASGDIFDCDQAARGSMRT